MLNTLQLIKLYFMALPVYLLVERFLADSDREKTFMQNTLDI